MTHPETPVEALMTPQPVALRPTDTVDDALGLLERYPFRHLPVVALNELVGMVSGRDLAHAAGLPRGSRARGHGPRRPRTVEELMQRPVHVVTPATTAQAAVELLLERGIGALPVVSADGHVVGIVTATDFLRQLERGAPAADGSDPADASVETCMSCPVETAAPGEDLLEAAERLHASHVHHLPVVAGTKLVGMLSDRDVRRGLARLVRADRRLEAEQSAEVPRLAVEAVMTRPCMTVAHDQPLHAAAHILIECRIGALPVLRGERMIGIVTQTDLLACFRDRSATQRSRASASDP
jgi:CBS domain-containing protein